MPKPSGSESSQNTRTRMLTTSKAKLTVPPPKPKNFTATPGIPFGSTVCVAGIPLAELRHRRGSFKSYFLTNGLVLHPHELLNKWWPPQNASGNGNSSRPAQPSPKATLVIRCLFFNVMVTVSAQCVRPCTKGKQSLPPCPRSLQSRK